MTQNRPPKDEQPLARPVNDQPLARPVSGEQEEAGQIEGEQQQARPAEGEQEARGLVDKAIDKTRGRGLVDALTPDQAQEKGLLDKIKDKLTDR